MCSLVIDSIPGNEPIKGYLKRMVTSGRIANSLLFAGSISASKEQFALALAQSVLEGSLEHHPDLHVYRPEGKLGLYSIETLREFGHEVYLPPYSGKRKVFILEDAHRMWPVSANALLKTFEEPPSDTIIILISHCPQLLLPTVLSRCRSIFFQPGPQVSKEHTSLATTFLAKPRKTAYKEFLTEVKGLSEQFEQKKKIYESAAKEDLGRKQGSDLSAAQKQSLEKQVDGAVSMALHMDLGQFFEEMLEWYRDLQLLRVNGPRSALLRPECYADMQQAVERGEILSLEEVQAAIQTAKLALERSTPISHVLESLFLRLNIFRN